jgi:predicted aspartyl protease
MIYTFDYDNSYVPAIPIVEVEVKQEDGTLGVRMNAIVDSGADATIIPKRYLQQIQAQIGDQAWLRGATQERIQVDLYWVWLYIGNLRPMYVEVVADSVGEEAILGRDVLNQFIVTLNGLASTVEISD